ncbi:MAG: hypothetical protein GIW97_06475 [Candidatus Eremiobacteraeota bacterium]|nr:hypothetical protein [Candidatus Eremiobacteraeota bacterium]
MRAFKIAAISAAVALTPAPPGTVMQKAAAYLEGPGAHSRYQIIASRTPLGKPVQYQWYLSVYAQSATDNLFQLTYQSPSATDRFAIVPKLEQGHGTPMYFPQETVSIIGSGQLMGQARDQTLVMVHAAGADCGESTLSVLSIEDGVVTVPVQVSNLCGLSASIRHHTIVLRGPYYNASAPAYKPTKNSATATLRYVDNRWVETPHYFKLNYPKLPAPAAHPEQTPTPMFTPIFKAIIATPAPSGGAPATPRPG